MNEQVYNEEKSSSAKSKKTCSYVFLSSLITKSVLDAIIIFPSFSDPLSHSLLLLYCISFSSPPSTCMPDGQYGYFSYQHSP